MQKNILIVTESFTLGGLETQMIGEISHLTQLGWDVYLAVGRNYTEEALPHGYAFVLKDLPIGPDATLRDLFASSTALTDLIREKGIDCIHCHPFTSFLPALFASLNAGIRFAYTLHGPASLDAVYGPFYQFLVEGMMYPAASLVTCVSDEVYSLALSYVPEDSLLLLPNGVDVEKIRPMQAGDPDCWLIVSRLDIFKTAGIKALLSYAKDGLFHEIDIIGDGPAFDDLSKLIDETPELRDRVKLLGRKTNVPNFFEGYGGVAGMGRVVLEACAANLSTMLLGYEGPKGLVDVALAERARMSNFSGRGMSTVGAQELNEQLKNLRQSPASYQLRDWIEMHHNEARIWADFAGRLEAAHPVHSPVAADLMQFLVEKSASGQHTSPFLFDEGLWDEVGRFLSSRYYRSYAHSTFKRINAARRKEEESLSYGPIAERDEKIKSLNAAVSERDVKIALLGGQINSLNNQVATLSQQVVHLNTVVSDLYKSSSWRITRPMRFAKRFFSNPVGGSFELASYVFWHTSPTMQRQLEAPARGFLRRFRRTKAKMTGRSYLVSDISKRFDIPENFIEQYRSKTLSTIDWSAKDWDDLYEKLSPVQRLGVPFAMSTVQRGRAMLSLLADHSCIHHKGRYLDVGTAYGGFLRAAKEIGFEEVVGLELQAYLAEFARANVAGLSGAQVLTADFIQDDISELGTFDLITCNDVIEHVDDASLAIQRMVSLLNENGTLSFEVPNQDCIQYVQADGHFLIFGITQLEKPNAAKYFSAYTGATESGYFFEMGEMYELDWYFDRLAENGMSSFILDTHQIGTIHDVPRLIADLREAYRTWQKETMPKLSPEVCEMVSTSVERYLENLEKDYFALDLERPDQAFIDKYLRSFWTIIASRHR